MTPYKIMELSLASVGLSISNSAFKTRAREYLDLTAIDITNRTRWLWRFKDTTLTTVAAQRAYSLASDVLEPLQFRDQTNDQPLEMWTTDTIDHADPGDTESGQTRAVIITGINSSTGYWSVALFPTPSAVTTVAYRYFAYWVPLATNGNDDLVDLAPKIPLWVQPALIHGTTEKYYTEKGNFQLAANERQKMEAIIATALDRNIQARGSVRTRLERADERAQPFDFRVREGTLS